MPMLSRVSLTLGLLLTACTSPRPVATLAPSVTHTALSAPVSEGSPTPTATALPVTVLQVKLLSPADEATINTPQVEVRGEAPPGTVITLNDVIVMVEATGVFAVTVPLEEGPNLIDIVASDLQGNEVSAQLTVTYDPES